MIDLTDKLWNLIDKLISNLVNILFKKKGFIRYICGDIFYDFKYGVYGPIMYRLFGHKIKVDSYHSPETTYEDWECVRCNRVGGGRHIYIFDIIFKSV